jgi:hypothetical protein
MKVVLIYELKFSLEVGNRVGKVALKTTKGLLKFSNPL